MRNEIRDYLMNHRADADVDQFTDQDSLLEAGVIDSLAMVAMINHLESTYGIEVDEDEMVPENFDSVDGIVDYVQQKLGC